ncbi:hypothetical protein L9F63_017507, partial [Diploptera punctata]
LQVSFGVVEDLEIADTVSHPVKAVRGQSARPASPCHHQLHKLQRNTMKEVTSIND